MFSGGIVRDERCGTKQVNVMYVLNYGNVDVKTALSDTV